MSGVFETVLRAKPEHPLFARGAAWVSAGEVRDLAAGLAPRLGDGPMFLHTTSAARFAAGLLAAAARGKSVSLPAHVQPSYLDEIGCTNAALVTDESFDRIGDGSALRMADANPLLTFFTSGSTSAPKPVEKSLSRLEIEARALDDVWGADAGHVIATVSHQHIYGMLFRVVWPLLSRRTSDDQPAAYWEDLKGRFAGATVISSPAHLTRLPPHAGLFAPPPALIFSSGQLLPADAALACIAAFGKPATEVLGSTETGGIAWRRQTASDAAWTPFPSVETSSDDEGALIVRSPYLQTGDPLQTGDTVEFNPDGSFRLKPRGDRITKIDGKRVSLARVEDELSAAPEIAVASALTLPARGDALAAIVVLTTQGRACLAEEGAFRLSRRLRVANDKLEPAERPKHWRFIDAIPTDTQGKRVLSTLRALFDSGNPLDTLDLDMQIKSESEADIAFALPPELIFFQGHFPDRAILPGVAQAHLAVLIAQQIWGDWPSDANLARLKFRRVLLPNDAVILQLKRDAKIGRIHFAYKFGDIIASQGEIGGFTR